MSISLDNIVSPTMTVSDRAMAADQARAGSGGLLGALLGTPAVNGKGIGVAVVDSGIATPLGARREGRRGGELCDRRVRAPLTRLVTARTSPASSPAIGELESRRPLYKNGVAPGAHSSTSACSNRVGVGYTSDVIAGIQWVVANRVKYSIRVDEPVARPSDPAAVRRSIRCAWPRRTPSPQGLVVVASAGNAGKDAEDARCSAACRRR